jgi:precorrin-6B methylase 2
MDHDKILGIADKIECLVRQGYGKDIIRSRVKGFSDEIFSIAKARMRNAREQKIDPGFIFTEEDLRFCTNRLVAEYRASRLKCGKIVDVGCGIGIQAIGFAKHCGRVIAIDSDWRKLGYAKANAGIAGVDNIEFVQADALDALGRVKNADIIFWDPERPEAESERTLDSLKPSFTDIVSAAQRITADVAVELPPQMVRSRMKADCEFEYISVDGRLNRLVVYFGMLRKCAVSAVALPAGERLEHDGCAARARRSRSFLSYAYEVDAAVARSGLLDFFVCGLKDASVVDAGGKSYLTSKVLLKSAFLKAYKVVGQVDVAGLKDFLVRNGFGRAVPHGSIDEGGYAELRKRLESGLEGDASAHVFLVAGTAVVAVRI